MNNKERQIRNENIVKDILAEKTAGYVSADISEMVNQAALATAKNDGEVIEMATLLETIRKGVGQWPSVTAEQLRQHEIIRDKFELKTPSRRPIGFNAPKE